MIFALLLIETAIICWKEVLCFIINTILAQKEEIFPIVVLKTSEAMIMSKTRHKNLNRMFSIGGIDSGPTCMRLF